MLVLDGNRIPSKITKEIAVQLKTNNSYSTLPATFTSPPSNQTTEDIQNEPEVQNIDQNSNSKEEEQELILPINSSLDLNLKPSFVIENEISNSKLFISPDPSSNYLSTRGIKTSSSIKHI